MRIIYRDEFGIVSVIVDSSVIEFFNNEVWFDSNGEEYRIPTKNILEIELI